MPNHGRLSVSHGGHHAGFDLFGENITSTEIFKFMYGGRSDETHTPLP